MTWVVEKAVQSRGVGALTNSSCWTGLQEMGTDPLCSLDTGHCRGYGSNTEFTSVHVGEAIPLIQAWLTIFKIGPYFNYLLKYELALAFVFISNYEL